MLQRLGLHRRELRAWAMYDWANSAFQTTIVAAVFPIYLQRVAAVDLGGPVATERFAWATTMAIIIVALVVPALGPIADYAAVKKPWPHESARNAPFSSAWRCTRASPFSATG